MITLDTKNIQSAIPKKSKGYILNNEILIKSINLNLTPTLIHAELIKNGIINPNTLQPYSLMTVKRLIQTHTNKSIHEYMLAIANNKESNNM
jgi:hypothetical protein